MTAAYDVSVRTVECRQCGAPLEVKRGGGQVPCAYCRTVNDVLPRTVDRPTAAPSAAAEVARLGQLEAQRVNPVSGHAYDLARPPLGLDEGSPLEVLSPRWEDARRSPPAGAAAQRDLCWLALHVATHHEQRGALTKSRAVLESALDHLDDAGHRHLVRCQLARAAVRAGDAEAALRWLDECDAAAEVLELDSAYRIARSQALLALGRPAEAFAILGDVDTPTPIHDRHRVAAGVLRAGALEASGESDRALTALSSTEEDGPLEATAEALEVVPETLERWRRERDRARVEALRRATRRSRPAELARNALWLCIPASFLGTFLLSNFAVMGGYGPDFGLSSPMICPLVCDGCTGPYSSASYYATNFVYCQPPASEGGTRPEDVELVDYTIFDDHREAWAPYLVPGHHATSMALGFLSFLPVWFLLSLLALRARRNRAASRFADARAELDALLDRLGPAAPEPPPPPTAWATLRGVLAIQGTFVAIALAVIVGSFAA